MTLGAWLTYVATTVIREFINNGTQGFRFTTEAVSYLVIVTLLAYSSLAYLFTRQGFFLRTRTHRRVARADLDDYFSRSIPTMTVLVPSYQEDATVIRNTLLTAALQEYPYLRVVLLIDDTPNPGDARQQALLAGARAMPSEISELLKAPSATFEAALQRFEAKFATDVRPDLDDMAELQATYEHAAAWLQDVADRSDKVDHTNRFIGEQVVGRLADDLAKMAEAIGAAAREHTVLPVERMRQLYSRLAWTFRAELSSFERKQYASLSHASNKATNLNSYIGLMGGAYREEVTPDGVLLQPTSGGTGSLAIPEPDYILTLDADSVLLPEYCLRLVYLMELPENRNVGVAQTPYSSYPGAATRIERIAGATTDLQHIAHQGMTHYEATFWVGANAVLRKRALDDIMEIELLDGIEVHRYIRDRTVIEDTDSSLDLLKSGWTLFNYPERLSYSATPSDFGALCVQRRRWANGGLLILPRLWSYHRDRRQHGRRGRLGEIYLRANYLASIAWASLGLLILLAYPYNDRLLSPLVLVAAVPYFLAMSSDLKRCGYRRLDTLRIYGFNLMLLPVNLSGVGSSVGQSLTARKLVFARTPKVRNRTTAPLLFVLIPYLIIGFSIYTVFRDIHHAQYGYAAFAGVNALLCAYAVLAYVGLKNSLVDIGIGLGSLLFVENKKVERRRLGTVQPSGRRAKLDWANVLQYGSEDPTHPPPRFTIPARVPEPSAPVVAPAPAEPTTPVAPPEPVATPTPVASEARAYPRAEAPSTVAGGPLAQSVVVRLEQYAQQQGGHLVLRLEGSSLVMMIEYPADEPAGAPLVSDEHNR